MTEAGNNDRPGLAASSSRRNGVGAWLVVTVLMLLLVAAAVIGYLGWTLGDADVPTSGYVAMAFGVVFSLAFGIGLMALVFYSSRKGYDEPAVLIEQPDADDGQKTPGSDVI
ncbi:hypothetical protein [Bradyrhizobium lablabi]|uniref:hypothetical protein n=1 Tax=Bradyrhizobium lablabi TaxID=722472 RepID=UPI00090C44B4|nr:hypothetical protein [Bradyrhizobium lablabi]SHL83620.1 hypothetical protein SAMN05444321_4273 [Bradyrhizobium lablabi]